MSSDPAPDAQPKLPPTAPPSTATQSQSQSQSRRPTKVQLENDRLRSENELLKEECNRLRSEAAMRERYARSIFRVIVGVLVFDAVVLAVHIRLSANHLRGLSDPILATLLGATTASVLGLLVIVIRYLFPGPNPRARRRRPKKPPPSKAKW